MEVNYLIPFAGLFGLGILKNRSIKFNFVYVICGIVALMGDKILLYMTYMTIGFAIAPIIANICWLIAFGTMYKKKYGFYLEYEIVICAIAEELLFRDIVIYMLKKYNAEYMSIFICGVFFTYCFIELHNVKCKGKIDVWIYSILLFITAYCYPGLNHGLHIGRNCYIRMNEIREETLIRKLDKLSFLLCLRRMKYKTPFQVEKFENAYCLIVKGKVQAEFNYVFMEKNILLCYALRDDYKVLSDIVKFIKETEKEVCHIYVMLRDNEAKMLAQGFELEVIQRKNEKKDGIYYDHYIYTYNCN